MKEKNQFNAWYYSWRTWFAWYPVLIDSEWIWGEKVGRKLYSRVELSTEYCTIETLSIMVENEKNPRTN